MLFDGAEFQPIPHVGHAPPPRLIRRHAFDNRLDFLETRFKLLRLAQRVQVGKDLAQRLPEHRHAGVAVIADVFGINLNVRRRRGVKFNLLQRVVQLLQARLDRPKLLIQRRFEAGEIHDDALVEPRFETLLMARQIFVFQAQIKRDVFAETLRRILQIHRVRRPTRIFLRHLFGRRFEQVHFPHKPDFDPRKFLPRVAQGAIYAVSRARRRRVHRLKRQRLLHAFEIRRELLKMPVKVQVIVRR